MTDPVHGTAAPDKQQRQTPSAVPPNSIVANENEHEHDRASQDAKVSQDNRSPLARFAVGLWADPAPVVALTAIFGRIAIATGTGVPNVLLNLLAEHLLRGDLACRLVADWLTRTGAVDRDRFVALSETDSMATFGRRIDEDSTNVVPPVRPDRSTDGQPALWLIRGGRTDG